MTYTKLNLYSFLFTLFAVIQMAVSGTIAPSSSASHHHIFARQLFKQISLKRSTENVIMSPASIQTCLTLVFEGTTGKTAQKLREGLFLGVESRERIAQNYADFIGKSFGSTRSDGPILTMANNIYLNKALEINPLFADIAKKYFNSSVEAMNFGDSDESVKAINSWVELQTNNRIRDLLQPGAVDAETTSILVNAIYFKGLWQTQFSKSLTSKGIFHMANGDVQVDMMYADESFKYAELRHLEATALLMPYLNSDLSMLIILPNEKQGLNRLETKLAETDLHDILSVMTVEDVDVLLPRFKIEMELDLKETLSNMNMKALFKQSDDFSGILNKSTDRLRISDVRHKAFLEVNEAGSEAAAASFLKIIPMSLNFQQKYFKADHPFVFAILDTRAVYFAGHVAKF